MSLDITVAGSPSPAPSEDEDEGCGTGTATSNHSSGHGGSHSSIKKGRQKRGVLPKQATSIMRTWLFEHLVVSAILLLCYSKNIISTVMFQQNINVRISATTLYTLIVRVSLSLSLSFRKIMALIVLVKNFQIKKIPLDQNTILRGKQYSTTTRTL